MDSSFWLGIINLGWSIIHIKGYQVTIYKQYCVLLSEDLFNFTNSIDPDKMCHFIWVYAVCESTRLGVEFSKLCCISVAEGSFNLIKQCRP